MSLSVLTVPGVFAVFGRPDLMDPFYQRECSTVGNFLPTRIAPGWPPVDEVVNVKYRNGRLLRGQFDGRDRINAYLHASTADHILLYAHSMGALSTWLWLKEYAPTSDIDHDRVIFLMSGASRSLMTAAHISGSPYKVFNIIKQWEQFSDPPTVTGSSFYAKALANMNALQLHTKGYPTISLKADPTLWGTSGNLTNLFYPTSTIAPEAGGATYSQLETAYSRPYLSAYP